MLGAGGKYTHTFLGHTELSELKPPIDAQPVKTDPRGWSRTGDSGRGGIAGQLFYPRKKGRINNQLKQKQNEKNKSRLHVR